MGVLVPDLQAALVDPLPEVRATAARALGSLLRGMGEEHFQDLVPWLLTTLQSGVRPDAFCLLFVLQATPCLSVLRSPCLSGPCTGSSFYFAPYEPIPVVAPFCRMRLPQQA